MHPRERRATNPDGMSAAAATTPSEPSAGAGASLPAGWEALRGDPDVQFAPVPIPEIPPRQPSSLERLLNELFAFLGDLMAPVGRALAGSWWWLQWALLALAVLFALILLVRLLGSASDRAARRAAAAAESEGWRPDTAASLALLEDADRLAAAGRFEAATRLLLQRSVGQIAAAHPDRVEPSTTARELAALPVLPEDARGAFRTIAERVERSLFALRTLERADWEVARAAYASFALARLEHPGRAH